jgi:hypothetical protein
MKNNYLRKYHLLNDVTSAQKNIPLRSFLVGVNLSNYYLLAP